MTIEMQLVEFLVERLRMELLYTADEGRATEARAELAVTRECAGRIRDREPGWNVYYDRLRQWAVRFADDPGYRETWRPDSGEA